MKKFNFSLKGAEKVLLHDGMQEPVCEQAEGRYAESKRGDLFTLFPNTRMYVAVLGLMESVRFELLDICDLEIKQIGEANALVDDWWYHVQSVGEDVRIALLARPKNFYAYAANSSPTVDMDFPHRVSTYRWMEAFGKLRWAEITRLNESNAA